MTDKPRNRIYHGIEGNAEGADTRIFVVAGGGSPTERRDHVSVLYELAPEESFGWGYSGDSPGRTATAIIEDVLRDLVADLPAVADMPSTARNDLINEFLCDFVAHFHDGAEFWLPAQTVIRWAHGYIRERLRNSRSAAEITQPETGR
ncbi:hypothetical protein [Amycolatopsis sp. cmx-4-68]|uniref:hypothetical protein n=1 Tax=Amycolatopsis sp. cmx-4-68 TaxID=2790938 RepID=UPI00397E4417